MKYTYSRFREEALAFVNYTLQIDVSLQSCQFVTIPEDDPKADIIPIESQSYLEFTMITEGNKSLSFSVFYSIAHQLPELYLSAVDLEGGQQIKDPMELLGEEAKGQISEEKRSLFITQKEHPVLSRIVWYIHECRMPEIFGDTEGNRLIQWFSLIFPQAFGINLVSLDMAKQLSIVG
ncbi:hypothetical protein FGO68_gene10124 [Halteria grandinella]|uniref:Ubiquitin-like-conjugating enzyme ATG10 n=1 Tax=Halteria grandinella TaxID=5974 RepID=A0A8J8P3F0_HALGN|nr:hypothetical protein FGO68_gene10124 [Halteria grandinella]